MVVELGALASGHYLRLATDSTLIYEGPDKWHGPTHANWNNLLESDSVWHKKKSPGRHWVATDLNGVESGRVWFGRTSFCVVGLFPGRFCGVALSSCW